MIDIKDTREILTKYVPEEHIADVLEGLAAIDRTDFVSAAELDAERDKIRREVWQKVTWGGERPPTTTPTEPNKETKPAKPFPYNCFVD